MSSMSGMAMSTAMPSMASTTFASPASASSMSSGMGSSSMSGMGSSSMSTMDASSMAMVFFTSINTPLYSTHWIPSSTGQYAGTCIFLILLALSLRCLLALKGVFEMRVALSSRVMGPTYRNGKPGAAHQGIEEAKAEPVPVTTEESLVRTGKALARPWRLSVDGSRAVLDLLIMGVGYLLMLAVMTFNVGYFLSVLGGSFLGSLLLGRYAVLAGRV